MSRWNLAGLVVVVGALYSIILTFVVDRWVMDEGERLWFRAMIRSRLPRLSRTPAAEPQHEGAGA
jgi:hypothetical protein